MPDVFLSYASADRERAREIASVFRARGWSVWWDRTIPPGRTYDQVIEDALDASRCVVVLWTKNSVQSDWVKIEADEGARRGILVPVLLEETRIPLAFRRIQASNLIGWNPGDPDPELDLLLQTISEILGEPADPPAPPPAAPVPEEPVTSAVLPRVNYVPVDDPAPAAPSEDPSPQPIPSAPSNKTRAPRPHGPGLAIEDSASAAPAWEGSSADRVVPAAEPHQPREARRADRRRVPTPGTAYLWFSRFIRKKLSVGTDETRIVAALVVVIAAIAFLILVDAPYPWKVYPWNADAAAADGLTGTAQGSGESRIDVVQGAVDLASLSAAAVTVSVSGAAAGGQRTLQGATVAMTTDSSSGFWIEVPRMSGYHGVFIHEQLTPGEYLIRVTRRGYRPATGYVRVERRRITSVDAVLAPD
ncbi:MAG TPA: TIR domain-containing protein [Longimicrobium sp.]|nr:TIR domain-containing protein [Longimicrobium sp.]